MQYREQMAGDKVDVVGQIILNIGMGEVASSLCRTWLKWVVSMM